jgi:tellurite resistance protein
MDTVASSDFTPEEWENIQRFAKSAQKLSGCIPEEVNGMFYNMTSIAAAADVKIFAFKKDG